ncbi:HAD family hydrolase [Streptomyces sp. NPDC006422]|uniref:HAD family hydrolase n=1 Tax=unclassified Streptomyces TaxID=2593676 RepID=UPI0033BA5DE3
MPLLMLDLDNTLVDRDAAFRASVRALLADHGLPCADLDRVIELDAHGYAARHDVAAALIDRYRETVPASAIHALLDDGGARYVVLDDSVRDALNRARASGWTPVIVTNGGTRQQEAKIVNTGLDRLVQGWAVSESVGHKKPEPEIFRAAGDIAGVTLSGAWVVGDSPHADIGGAHALRLPSVWVSNGRAWTETSYRPTESADDVAAAIGHVLNRPSQSCP